MDIFHFLLEQLRESWPKGLFGLIVPVSQVAWKLYRDRSPERRRKALRQEITELQKFLESFTEAKASPALEASRRAAQEELQEKMGALAILSGSAPPRAELGKAEPVPLPLESPVLASPPVQEAGAAYTFISAKRSSDRLRRWFLLYAPSRTIGWIPHALFFVSLTSFLLVIPIVLSEASQQPVIILAAGVWLGLALLFRGWAAYFEPVTQNSLRRWFLLYPPSRPIGWLPRTLFFVSLFVSLTLALSVVSLSEELRNREEIWSLVGALALWFVLTMLFRAWATAIDRNRKPSVSQSSPVASAPAAAPPRSRNLPAWLRGVQHSLLLYIPSRPAVLILHGLFYLGPALFLVALDTYFLSPTELVVNEAGHSMQAFLALPLAYIVLATLVIRDWAASFHPAGDAARKRIRWLFLGRPVRLAGWIPRVIYYAAGLFLPMVVFEVFLNHESGRFSLTAPFHSLEYLLWVSTPIIAIFISARGWARSFDRPKPPPQVAATPLLGRIRRGLLLDRPWPLDLKGWSARLIFYFAVPLLALAATQSSDVRLVRMMIAAFVVASARGWAASLQR